MRATHDHTPKLRKDSSKQTLRDYLAGKARLKKAKSEDRLLTNPDYFQPPQNPLKYFKIKIDEFWTFLRKNVDGPDVLRSSEKFIQEIIDLFEKTVINVKNQTGTAN